MKPKPFKLTPKYPSEHEEQSRLIRWATHRAATLPALRNLIAVPNGGYVLTPAAAAKLKAA